MCNLLIQINVFSKHSSTYLRLFPLSSGESLNKLLRKMSQNKNVLIERMKIASIVETMIRELEAKIEPHIVRGNREIILELLEGYVWNRARLY